MAKLQEKLNQKFEALDVEVIEPNENISNVTALPVKSKNVIKPLDMVPSFEITIEEAENRLKMLQKFVRDMLVPNEDYGMIPGCNKPSLFKPGAEKLCDIFGFSKQIEITGKVEDWDKGLFAYEVKVILISKRNGMVEAEGIGSCNSKEKKYKYQDAFTITNTLLKMAKKRAFVDAVLSATRSSGLFTQDVEDLDEVTPPAEPSNKEVTNKDIPKKPSPITNNQLNKIQSLVTSKKIPLDKIKALIKERYKVTLSANLTLKQADDLIKYLLNFDNT